MENLKIGDTLYFKKELPGVEKYTQKGEEAEIIGISENMYSFKVKGHLAVLNNEEVDKYLSKIDPLEESSEIEDNENTDEDIEIKSLEEKGSDITDEEIDDYLKRRDEAENNSESKEEKEEEDKKINHKARKFKAHDLNKETAIKNNLPQKKELDNLFIHTNESFEMDLRLGLLPQRIISKEKDRITIVITECGTKGISRCHEDDEWDALKGAEIAWRKAKIKELSKAKRYLDKRINMNLDILNKYEIE